MKIAKFWRSALAMSLALTVMLSITGGTIAWFTDSVTSANNVIKAGNLDIELEYWNNGAYTPVTANTKLFNEDALWEPGYTEVAYLKVTNAGSLALAYQLGVNVAGETVGRTKDGAAINLSEHLKFKVIENESDLAGTYDRAAAQAAAADGIALQNTYVAGSMKAGAEAKPHYLALIISMPTNVGNEANHDGTNVPAINMGVELKATQLNAESDSFDNQYDRDAQYDLVPVMSADEVNALINEIHSAKSGETVTVNAGVYELDAPLTIPAGVTLKGAQAGRPGAEWAGDATAQKTVFKLKDGEGKHVIHILPLESGACDGIVIDGIMIDGAGAKAGIYTMKDRDDVVYVEGLQIRNNVVMNAQEGIVLLHTVGAVVEGNYVENVESRAIAVTNYFNYAEDDDGFVCAAKQAYVRNNEINGVTATGNGAIHIECGSGNVTVSGNTVKNVNISGIEGDEEISGAAITVEDIWEDGVITVENNTIENVERGISVYEFMSAKYKYYTSSMEDEVGVSKVIIANNDIKNFDLFGIGTSNLHKVDGWEDYVTPNPETLVEITGNDFDTAVKALHIGEETTDWRVNATGNKVGGTKNDSINGEFTK